MIRKTNLWEREQFNEENKEQLLIIFHKEIKEQKKWNKTWNIENFDINYEHAQLIVDLYNIIENEAKKESMIDVLWNIISTTFDEFDSEHNYLFWWISLAFFTLCKLWYVDEAIKKLLISKYPISIILPIFNILSEWINYFNLHELSAILNVLKGINLEKESTYSPLLLNLKDILNELIDLIIDIRFDELKKKVNYTNIEINNDKKVVSEFLKEFWFDKKYNIILNKLDIYFQSEQNDEIVPWWVISILREFFKVFYIDLALKLAEINWLNEVPSNPNSTTDIWHARKYIEQEFWLSSDEYKLIDSYKDITNNTWAHSLLSNKKYFRLTKNIWIEIALFMLSKLEDYKKLKLEW